MKADLINLDPTLRIAAVAMMKDGLRSPTIARLLQRPHAEIELYLGWWVHDRMKSVVGRTYVAYRSAAAAELKVSFQSVMKWHLHYLLSCQVSLDSTLVAEATEEYCRQTPNVQSVMRDKLRGRGAELALLREFGYLNS